MSLPKEYIKLEYLESTGTQWIDTLIKAPSNELDYDVEFSILGSSNEMNIVFGASGGNGQSLSVADGRLEYRGTTSRFYSSFSYNTKYRALCYPTRFNLDGVDKPTDYSGGYRSNEHTIKLFASCHETNVEEVRYYSQVVIYYFKMYRNGTLIRDMIPAMRTNDKEIGMYDLANGVFYTNQGTNKFYGGGLPNIVVNDNPYDFKVNEDTQLTANFKKIGGKKYLIGS